MYIDFNSVWVYILGYVAVVVISVVVMPKAFEWLQKNGYGRW